MPNNESMIINIALVGGGDLCKEILQKTIFDYRDEGVAGPIIAVADPDPQTPGMVLARNLGLLTFRDPHDLYDPRHNIGLIIILTPDQALFENILGTRPQRIRIMSHHVFEIFWKVISHGERKLREQNKAMETILNGIQALISVITPDMGIIEVNEAFLKQMGYSRAKVIGRKCYQVFQKTDFPCNSPEILCPLKEVVRNQRPVRQIMARKNSRDRICYYEVNVYPIWEKDGKISQFIEIARDITARKMEEEKIHRILGEMVEKRTRQLEETHAKLLHQDKMASLGKLSASVVHEINNPIAGILNLVMLIRRIMEEGDLEKAEIDKFKEYLALMETETRRISRIVSNLLSFSRQSKMEMKRLNIIRLLERTLLLNSNLLKIHGVRVAKKFDTGMPDIVGSEDQLQQVFMNIVSNAAEAMDASGGGVLAIETGTQPQKGKIRVSFKDTGAGIPKANLPRLFEPFFTTKKKSKGVGLGLSVAYGIVQEHGGSISVSSRQGKGTTFVVELPLPQDEAPQPPDESA